MPKSTSYILTDHFDAYISSQIDTGRFKSASEVMTDALRVHEERSKAREAFLAAVDEGVQSPVTPFDFDDFLSRMEEKHADKFDPT